MDYVALGSSENGADILELGVLDDERAGPRLILDGGVPTSGNSNVDICEPRVEQGYGANRQTSHVDADPAVVERD